MAISPQVASKVELITFDCYGTLIDWSAGLAESLQTIFDGKLSVSIEQLFDAYVRIEAEIESGPFQSYRAVLTETVIRLAARFDVALLPGRAEQFPGMLPAWRPFPDTVDALRRLKRTFQLGILSNVDGDLFAGTNQRLGVEFDVVITAEDVRSYKPGHAHFQRLLAKHPQKDSILHVAQSLFHDGAPCGELDIAFTWINRYNESNRTSVKPLAEFADLKSLADALGA